MFYTNVADQQYFIELGVTSVNPHVLGPLGTKINLLDQIT